MSEVKEACCPECGVGLHCPECGVIVFIKDGKLCVQTWTREEIEAIEREAKKLKEEFWPLSDE